MCLFEAINQSSTLLFHMDVIHQCLMSIHPVAHLNKTISLFKKKAAGNSSNVSVAETGRGLVVKR